MKIIGFIFGTAGYALLASVDLKIIIGVGLVTIGFYIFDYCDRADDE